MSDPCGEWGYCQSWESVQAVKSFHVRGCVLGCAKSVAAHRSRVQSAETVRAGGRGKPKQCVWRKAETRAVPLPDPGRCGGAAMVESWQVCRRRSLERPRRVGREPSR